MMMKRMLLRVLSKLLLLLWTAGFIFILMNTTTTSSTPSTTTCPSSSSSSSSSSTSSTTISTYATNNFLLIIQQSIILLTWSISNWIPTTWMISLGIREQIWDMMMNNNNGHNNNNISYNQEIQVLPIPTILSTIRDKQQEQQQQENNIYSYIQTYLENTYGKDWKERPLLIEGLLMNDNNNDNNNDNDNNMLLLSTKGLLQSKQIIPYFNNANEIHSLTPTSMGSVGDIVQGMINGKPYKIGSQLLIQENPTAFEELISSTTTSTTSTSTDTFSTGLLLKELFGNHFTQQHLQPSFGNLIPATTTVPVFVARTMMTTATTTTTTITTNTSKDNNNEKENDNNNNIVTTGLHCEPIGNVAFQLSGTKQWTLVNPEYSNLLKPSLAIDGRAFFSSSLLIKELKEEENKIPYWTIVTKPGDALWVPTWTWHRVDYYYHNNNDNDEQEEIDILSIGGSIFHFRPWDFVKRNPLYAIMIIPALIKELAGIKTQ